MKLLVRVADLFQAPHATPVKKLWGMVLRMAHTDGATSIQYHPWRGEECLAYVLNGERVAIVSPPAHLAGELIEVAQTMFTNRDRGWFSRSTPNPACGEIEIAVGGELTVWDAVVWTTGTRSGVELFRVSPPCEHQTDKPSRVASDDE